MLANCNNFRQYAFANTIFDVVTHSELLSQKFEQLAYPYIGNEHNTKKCDCTLAIIIDDRYFACIEKKVLDFVPTPLVASYCSIESGTVRVEKYVFDGFLVIHTSYKNAFWCIDTADSKFFFVGKHACLEHFHREFVVLFEHIMTKMCVSKGAVLMHAAAVSKADRAVLFVGPKRSGKTTLLFDFCKKYGFSPISVDKVLLIKKDNSIEINCVPTRLRVLAGTLKKYSELYDRIPSEYKTASEEVLWRGESKSKVEIPLQDFENFAGHRFSCKSYLNTIVFNEITPNNKNQIVVGALSEHLHLTLKACIYSPYNPEEDWWSEIGYADVDTLKQHTQLVLQELNNSASFIEYKAKNNFDDLYLHIISSMEGNGFNN